MDILMNSSPNGNGTAANAATLKIPGPQPPLSEEDQRYLEQYECKLQPFKPSF